MSYVTFANRPSMRAVELDHCIVAGIPLSVAQVVAEKMGNPSFRGNCFSSYYGDANFQMDGRPQEVSMPFAMRITDNGAAAITCRYFERELMQAALLSLIPDLIVEVKPTVRVAA